MIVAKIGGCNGSGKSSVVRALIDKYKIEPTHAYSSGKHTKIRVYDSHQSNYIVLGDYSNPCGGMDTITNKDERLALIKQYARGNNIVIFEGLVASKAYGATGQLALSKGHKGHWLYAFMDTPFHVCVERVLARRKAAGNDAPFDPERTMRETYHVYENRLKSAYADGHRVLILNHTRLPKQLAGDFIKGVEKLNKELK